MMLRVLNFTAALFILTACSNLQDTAELPEELTAFKAEVKVVEHWTSDIGRGSGDFQTTLLPVIDDEKIYVSDHNGKISAYTKANGKRVWRSKLNRKISAALASDGSSLFLGTENGQLLAVDKQSGNILWEATLTGEMLATPVIELGIVVAQTSDGAINGVAADSGNILWTTRRTSPPLTLRGTGQPIVSNGLVVTGMDSGRLLAMTLLDGRVIWESPLGVARGRNEIERIADADIKPLINQGVIYGVSYQGRLAAVSAENGRLLWARDLSAYQGVSLDDLGSLYLADERSMIWSIDQGNGSTLWKQDKLRARRLIKPTTVDDYIVSADYAGYIHVLHSSDGRIVGRKQINGAGYIQAPIIDDERLYFVDRDGKLSSISIQAI